MTKYGSIHGGEGWRRLCVVGAVSVVLGLASAPGLAIGKIIVDIGEVTVPGSRAEGLSATLDLTHARAPSAHIRADQVDVPAPVGPLRDVEIFCGSVVIQEPRFACENGDFVARGGPTQTISMKAAGEYNSATHTSSAEGSGFIVAGGVAQFSGKLDARGWAVEASATALDIRLVRALVAPWVKVPDNLTFDGHFDAQGEAVNRAGAMAVNAQAHTADLNFTNEASTVVAEKVATGLRIAAERTSAGFDIEARLDGTSGQALAGPVLLDFGANPLRVDARGALESEMLKLDDVSIVQKTLSEAHAQALVSLGETPKLVQAHVDVPSLLFPAAYTSFLQIGLAASDFGQLKTTGMARGSVDIANNAVTQIDMHVNHVGMEDAKGKFSMSDLNADVHWTAGAQTQSAPSWVTWNRTSAYGLSGGATRLDFLAHGLGFELTKPARVPIFDGAVVVNTLDTRQLGSDDAELKFDAKIEPISMPLISRAFGWPEMSGQLAGSIPGLTYRNKVLSVEGDLVASVFDGSIVGRGFRLQDPLGPWPRLFANVTARNLDLSLVTRTFPIGSITGRLDADIGKLELFDWSPVAFDAKLFSTPGDRSKKLISQKAVTSISNVGGGGGGVTAALQSGVMRFFDDFRYDAIGLTCKLENEVCLMGGIEPAGIGYYIVRGKGLPRIDIIGNQGRVAWPQLVGQNVSGMHSNVVVR
ncbi:MAG TPA: hypothetical protein VGO53_07755 [Steroidobacteraceae bacterium]|nr:hypothetical protein [Steroidobacteraceae bacterium]